MFKRPEFWNTLGSLQKRIISAVILGSIVLGIMTYGGWLLAVLVTAMAVLAYREYLPLVQKQWPKSLEYVAYASLASACLIGGTIQISLGFVPLLIGFVVITMLAHLYLDKDKTNAALRIGLGLFYVGVPALVILWLRQIGNIVTPNMRWLMLLLPILGVWLTDTGAYFAGRTIGGPKIAPKISPNKTWAGLFGGMIAAALVMGIGAYIANLDYAALYFVLGAVLAVIAQIGDFFESYLKRSAGVKDSGNLIPGHGGILDRIDGVLTALPFFAVFVLILL